MFSSKKEPQEHVVALFELGAGSAAAGVAKLSKSTAPEIIWASDEKFVFEQKPSVEDFFRVSNRLVKRMSERLLAEGFPRSEVVPEIIIVAASAPWHQSRARTILEKRQRPFTIEKPLIERLLDVSAADVAKIFGVPLKSVERRFISSELNGYVSDSPFGKETSELLLHAFFHTIAEEANDSLQNLRKVFPHLPIKVFPTPLIDAVSYPHTEDTILVRIGGETTDLAVLRKGAIAELASLPYGEYHLNRSFAEASGVSPKAAPSALKLYLSGLGNKESLDRFAQAVEKSGKEWQEAFARALDGSLRGRTAPHKVAILSAVGDERIFKVLIEREPFIQQARSNGDFEVLISDDWQKSLINWRERRHKNSGLASLALFADNHAFPKSN